MGGDNSKQLEREKDLAERKARQGAERKQLDDEEKARRRTDIETTKKQFILSLQASSRAYIARENCAKLRQLQATRTKIANEILSTEKSYSNSLKLCIDIFYAPLMAAALAEESRMTRDFKKREQKSPVKQDSVKTKDNIENYYLKNSGGRTGSLEAPQSLDRRPTLSSLKTSEEYANIENVPEITELTREDVKMVFGIIETIYVFSQKMMEALEKSIKAKIMTETIGEQFLEMSDLFKGYIQYVNNYTSAMERLEKLNAQNPQFKTWLEATYLKPECNGNILTSYLIMPIQRIPRYQLLLQDLAKNVPEGMNKQKLDAALKKIIEVANAINEKKRESENFTSIVSIYNKLDPKIENLCAPHRRFVFQGNLKDKQDNETYLFILFNDIMLKVKETKNGTVLKMVHQIFLRNGTCVDIQDDPQKKIERMIQLELPQKTFILKAKTEEEKQKWIQLIRTGIEEQVTKSQSYSSASAKIHSVQ